MKLVKIRLLKTMQPASAGTPAQSGDFDTSARLDVQAALMRNHTVNASAWRTWDNGSVVAPSQFEVSVCDPASESDSSGSWMAQSHPTQDNPED